MSTPGATLSATRLRRLEYEDIGRNCTRQLINLT